MSLGSTLCVVPGLAAGLRPREELVVPTCWRAAIILWCLYLRDRRWYRVEMTVVEDEGKEQMEWRFPDEERKKGRFGKLARECEGFYHAHRLK